MKDIIANIIKPVVNLLKEWLRVLFIRKATKNEYERNSYKRLAESLAENKRLEKLYRNSKRVRDWVRDKFYRKPPAK